MLHGCRSACRIATGSNYQYRYWHKWITSADRNENKLPIIVTTRFDKESLLDRFYQSEDEELAEDVIEKLYQFCYGIELKKYDENEKKKVSISD